MRREYRYNFILVLLILSVLTGCSKAPPEMQETFSNVNTLGVQVKDEGVFYIDISTSQMMFYDYNTQASIAICDNPNCRHNLSDCNAYIEDGYMSTMGCYRGNLYYFNINDPECSLYKCDKNGSNRKVFVKLNKGQKHQGCDISRGIFFVENELIFACAFSDYVPPEEAAVGDSLQRAWNISKVNLDNGEIEVIKQFEMSLTGNMPRFLECWGRKIIYEYEGYIYALDIDSGEESIIFESDDPDTYYMGIRAIDNKMYYSKMGDNTDAAYEVDMITGEEKCLFYMEKEAQECFLFLKPFGDALYYEHYVESTDTSTYGRYDLQEGKHENTTREEYIYLPQYQSDNWYCMILKEGWGFLPKSAYQTKDWSQLQIVKIF